METDNKNSENMPISILKEVDEIRLSNNKRNDFKKLESVIDKKIGQTLRYFRRLKGMHQDDLGELIGITYQQFSKYEKGENRINLSKLLLLCYFMNVNINDFMDTLSLEKNELLEYGKEIGKYLRLNKEKKEIINRIIDVI